MTTGIDVFLDLSASPLTVPSLQLTLAKSAHPERLGAVTRRVTAVLAPELIKDSSLDRPANWIFAESHSAAHALDTALSTAGRDHVPLLLLLGAVDVNGEAVGELRQCLERDPMFGFAVPRIGCPDRCCIARLTRHGVGTTDWLTRRILADLPDTEIFLELVAPCMLIAPDVADNCGPLVHEFEGLAAALLHYMSSARRCGFRTVLSNRVVVSLDGLACEAETVELLPAPSRRDEEALHRLVPDLARNWQGMRTGSWERFEKLCSSIADETKRARNPSLLLDLRNVGPLYNGTSQAVLGTAKAFQALRPSWDVAILADTKAAAFHEMDRVYAGWPVHTSVPDRAFTVTFRPAQPWHIQEMVDLHNVAIFNVYFMLDTIAWDIAYLTPPSLDGAWAFLADYADGLMFDSEFTRQRFIERFPSGRTVPASVTHFSFDPCEYVLAGAAGAADGEFILVIGNDLAHKDVRRTVDTLASGFPFRHIRAVGPTDVSSSFVRAHRSGGLPERDLHRLYANAQYVVFPSLYEGFGFPIVTALAYGRTVLARRSALLEEIASQCERRGRLITFDRRDELVELIGRLSHGEAVPETPLGAGLASGRPRNWCDAAREMFEFIKAIASNRSHNRWIVREHAIQQMVSYRS